MVNSRRFVTVALAGAIVAGLALAAVSIVVAPLSVSMSVLTAVNAGLVAACVDTRRIVATKNNNKSEPNVRPEIGAVAIITASALVGSQGMFRVSAEAFLSTALLVLTTGYAGFYLGLLANRIKDGHNVHDTDAVGR